MKDFLPPYLENIANLKQKYEIVGNLKEAITFHFVGPHQYNLVMAKDIVCTLVASSQPMRSTNGKGIAKMLGVDKRNMKRDLERRILLDTENDAFWLRYKCVRRSNCLSNKVRNLVINWWENETTISLNMKDVEPKGVLK